MITPLIRQYLSLYLNPYLWSEPDTLIRVQIALEDLDRARGELNSCKDRVFILQLLSGIQESLCNAAIEDNAEVSQLLSELEMALDINAANLLH